MHQIVEAFRNSIAAVQDQAKAELFIRGVDGLDDFSDAERVQYISVLQSILRVWEEAYYHYRNGRLDPEMWEAMLAQYKDLLRKARESYGD